MWDKALNIYFKMLECDNNSDDIITITNIGNAYLIKNNYPLAEKYLKAGLKNIYLQKMNQTHFYIVADVYNDLSRLEQKRRNYKIAFEFADSALVYKNLDKETRNRSKIEELKINQEENLKKQEIALLEQNNFLYRRIIAFVVIILLKKALFNIKSSGSSVSLIVISAAGHNLK